MEHSLEWQPGNYGKGFVAPDGSVHNWSTDGAWGGPHHFEKIPNSEDSDTPKIHRQLHAFEIGPDGTVGFSPLSDGSKRDHVLAADPRLKGQAEEHWKFTRQAGMTDPQRQRALAQEDDVWPDTSEVHHTFDNGWTVRKLMTHGDKLREGRLMNNCWATPWKEPTNEPVYPELSPKLTDQDASLDMPIGDWWKQTYDFAPDHHQYYSLRDHNNYPRGSFSVSGGEASNALGHGNAPLRPEYASMINEWADRAGIPSTIQKKPEGWGYPRRSATSVAKWQPGTHGKGLLFRDGTLHSWSVDPSEGFDDYDGAPTHVQYFKDRFMPRDANDRAVGEEYDDSVLNSFWLNPEGKVKVADWNIAPELEAALNHHHPDAVIHRQNYQEGEDPNSEFKIAASPHQLNFQRGSWGKGLITKDGVIHTWNVAAGDDKLEDRTRYLKYDEDGAPSHRAYMENNGINWAKDASTFFVIEPDGWIRADPATDRDDGLLKQMSNPEDEMWNLSKTAGGSAFATELKLFLDQAAAQIGAREGPTPHHDHENQFIQQPPGVLARIRNKFKRSGFDRCPRCGEMTVGTPCDVCGYDDRQDYEAQKEDWYGNTPPGSPTKFPFTSEPWRTEHHAPTVGLASTKPRHSVVLLSDDQVSLPLWDAGEDGQHEQPHEDMHLRSGLPRVVWHGDPNHHGLEGDHSFYLDRKKDEVHIGPFEYHHGDLFRESGLPEVGMDDNRFAMGSIMGTNVNMDTGAAEDRKRVEKAFGLPAAEDEWRFGL